MKNKKSGITICIFILLAFGFINISMAQDVVWTTQLGTSGYDYSHGVTTDDAGNVYITGSTDGSLGGTNAGWIDAFVTKYDSTGNLQWMKQLGTSTQESATGITTDRSGNVYISGSTYGSLGGTNAGGNDAFIAKYDTTGNLQWTKQLGTSRGDGAIGVAADSTGSVYITGVTYGTLGGSSAGSQDAFVAKYDTTGNLQWTKQLGTSNDDTARGIATDSAGNVYISGYTGWGADAFVAKYDTVGNLKWTEHLVSNFNYNGGVATDSTGNVYVTGSTHGSLGGPNVGGADAYVAKYNTAGSLQWIKQLGTSHDDTTNGVTTDSAGNVYITGQTYGGSLGGPTTGGMDAFVAKYDTTGSLKWVEQLAMSSNETSRGVATDNTGNVYITGYTTTGYSDAFLSKIEDPAMNPQTVYGLFVGVRDYGKLNDGSWATLKADMNAENIYNAFKNNGYFDSANSVLRTADVRWLVTGVQDYEIRDAIIDIKSHMDSNDKFVLYIGSHGYEDTLILNRTDLFTGYLSADELYEYLKVLDGYDKLVFLDACHSGSFVSGGDLELLHKIAFLSSATADSGAPFGEDEGYYFGYALAEALKIGPSGYPMADGYEHGDPDGVLTVDEIYYFIDHYVKFHATGTMTVYYGDFDAYSGVFTEDMWKLTSFKSDDFSGDFMTQSVPEPTTMLLLGLGLVGLAGLRRRLVN